MLTNLYDKPNNFFYNATFTVIERIQLDSRSIFVSRGGPGRFKITS